MIRKIYEEVSTRKSMRKFKQETSQGITYNTDTYIFSKYKKNTFVIIRVAGLENSDCFQVLLTGPFLKSAKKFYVDVLIVLKFIARPYNLMMQYHSQSQNVFLQLKNINSINSNQFLIIFQHILPPKLSNSCPVDLTFSGKVFLVFQAKFSP